MTILLVDRKGGTILIDVSQALEHRSLRSEFLLPVVNVTPGCFGFPAEVEVNAGAVFKVKKFVRTTPTNEDHAIFEERVEGEE